MCVPEQDMPNGAIHAFPTRRSSDLGVWQGDRAAWRFRLTKAKGARVAYQARIDHCWGCMRKGILKRFRQIVAWQARLADRKSTRLNSSHVSISYAVFCLKKKIIIMI